MSDRYEAIHIIVKVQEGMPLWADQLYEWITENCASRWSDEEDAECTCGVESFASSAGTLEQCYKWIGVEDDEEEVQSFTADDFVEVHDYWND